MRSLWGRKSSGNSNDDPLSGHKFYESNGNQRDSAKSSVDTRLRQSHSSFTLSDNRREELLLAARKNRFAWVDTIPSTLPNALLESNEDLLSSTEVIKERKRLVSSSHNRLVQEIESDVLAYLDRIRAFQHEMHEGWPSTSNSSIQSTIPSMILTRSILDEADSMKFELNQFKTDLLLRRERYWKDVADLNSELQLTEQERAPFFLLAFREFIAFLKDPSVCDIVYNIQCFVHEFTTRAREERTGERIHEFITKITPVIRKHPVYNTNADMTLFFKLESEKLEYGHQFVHEILEAFLMEKLYPSVYGGCVSLETEDAVLYERIESLQFIQFHHIDLPTIEEADAIMLQRWDALVVQVREFVVRISPRRKMDCLLEVCRVLTSFVTDWLQTSGSPKSTKTRSPLAADEFLPAFIFLVLQANPVGLKQAIAYVFEFRHPSQLVSESRYFLTHLLGSIEFLETLNFSQLTITEEEFRQGLAHQRKNNLCLTKAPEARKSANLSSNSSSEIDVLSIRFKRLQLSSQSDQCNPK
uniref:Uncharacterized protein AlNc14C344G10834 n=1 Tax=Albugo laibachii Nc14 TaxID=890382 RepID=F0WX76_9STRA|nr:conserved hypothetical protein [Albugo laibachii Nc14]|eukprot:CCA26068.1 conserved hypothetical protein [Albugo laibachii Nc14]